MITEFFLDPWNSFWVVVYVIAILTSVRVIMDTHSSTKTSAYLLLILLLPIAGTIVYFTFGVNYRKIKIFRRKFIGNAKLFQEIKNQIVTESAALKQSSPDLIGPHTDLIDLLVTDSYSPLSRNSVTLLLNGEQKFPEVIHCLQAATDHIHMEYYIFENDTIGNTIKEILIRKSKEGVKVRLIYDAFGSMGFRRNVKKELEQNGVEVYPFYQVRFPHLASRINYRNHRKIIVIDGIIGFTGGINIADRYINNDTKKLYWRDTHIKIEGDAVRSLQYHFLSSWSFCADERAYLSGNLFPAHNLEQGDHLTQIVSSGPDYKRASIMLAYFTAIATAKKCVYITTPYFIPNESIINAIRKAALSGKDVRLLVPEDSDSWFVNAASRFYYKELLETGVRVFLYQKGFVHSKTMVVDDRISLVGTANMDFRSFDLNFEINAVVYGTGLNTELKRAFLKDLEDSRELNLDVWNKRSGLSIFFSSLARIFSPML